MHRRRFTSLAMFGAVALAWGPTARAAKAPTTWDNLVRVQSKRLKYVYLAPGADFRGYHKVMLDPTEIAFEKNWRRDYNNTTASLGSRISESDVQKAITEGVKASNDIFSQAFTDAGFPVVDAPGPDVLRVRTGLVNVRVSAPDKATAGRTYNFAQEAGSATFVVEVRDSETGALMGRAVDAKIAGDLSRGIRNSVTNRADFRNVVKTWAKTSAQGLNELKSRSPINTEGAQQTAQR